jgi:class 3 adenylate cyclase
MPETRQLAAIMFTDIVGYTALMGRVQNPVSLTTQNRNH